MRLVDTIIVIAAIITVLFISCSSEIKNSTEASKSITYVKDNRTGLCFGQQTSTSYSGYTITSITCVPCDSVKNLLK